MDHLGARLPSTKPIAVGAGGTGETTDRAWWCVATVGVLATAGYLLAPGSVQEPGHPALGLVGVLAILAGVHRHRPAHRAGWYLLAAANACFVAGDTAGLVLENVTGRPAPSPSVADLLYLAGYPLLIAAVHLLARAAGVQVTREHRIDAAVISVGFLAAG